LPEPTFPCHQIVGASRWRSGTQVAPAATRWAKGARDLVLLVIDPDALAGSIRIAAGRPQLVGPLPCEAVRLVVDFAPQADGTFMVPEEARLAELELGAPRSASEALDRARQVMEGFGSPWWLGGGWATDAPTGVVSRAHLDLDIVILRPDLPVLHRHLAGWELRTMQAGTLQTWEGDQESVGHQVWARPDDGRRLSRWQDFAADPGFVELLVEWVSEGAWTYRRDPRVRAPLARLGRPGGFLNPEVALLYKAPAALDDRSVTSGKARMDFDHVVGHLDRDQRAWLVDALERSSPGHPWIGRLSDSASDSDSWFEHQQSCDRTPRPHTAV